MNGRRIILTMAAALALVAGGTAAGAAISSKGPVDSSGVVHGCYTTNAVKDSHFFVLQDAGISCPRGTTAIMWNQQGPRGSEGSPGRQGSQGVAGLRGPAGTSGWSGQVQFNTDAGGHIVSPKIVSQAGPSVLSVKVDPNSTVGIIFTGKNLPTKMFPSANQIFSSAPTGIAAAGNAVANTSFEIDFEWDYDNETGIVYDYFLPSD